MQEREKHRILIIEDSLLNQHIVQSFLEEDYVLAMATTAEEGDQAAHTFRPDLILLKIALPNVGGFDLLARLKESSECKDVPVVIITGPNGDEDEERGFLLGAADYIREPLKETIVKARIKTQIRIVEQIQTIEQLGLVDALTGVPNRRHFENQSQYEWGRTIREHTCLSLMMMEVDAFKEYNDTYGHPQGDAMLKTIGQLLRENLNRSVDVLCRYGEELFVVMLPNTDADGAAVVAERLRAAVEAAQVPLVSAGGNSKVTVSIGAASARPQIGHQLAALLEAANARLARAKGAGRNRVELEIL